MVKKTERGKGKCDQKRGAIKDPKKRDRIQR